MSGDHIGDVGNSQSRLDARSVLHVRECIMSFANCALRIGTFGVHEAFASVGWCGRRCERGQGIPHTTCQLLVAVKELKLSHHNGYIYI